MHKFVYHCLQPEIFLKGPTNRLNVKSQLTFHTKNKNYECMNMQALQYREILLAHNTFLWNINASTKIYVYTTFYFENTYTHIHAYILSPLPCVFYFTKLDSHCYPLLYIRFITHVNASNQPGKTSNLTELRKYIHPSLDTPM